MMKINKIQNTNLNLKVRGQGCADDCTEKKVWVGKLDGNTQGCVYYDTVSYTHLTLPTICSV